MNITYTQKLKDDRYLGVLLFNSRRRDNRNSFNNLCRDAAGYTQPTAI